MEKIAIVVVFYFPENRADKSRNRQNGGFGLGLALAKDIVQKYNGKITVTSKPEKGSTFGVTLPKI